MTYASSILAARIQIEHLNDPVGIDYTRPEIEIPCNQAAKVLLPDREAMTLAAGKYSF